MFIIYHLEGGGGGGGLNHSGGGGGGEGQEKFEVLPWWGVIRVSR